MSSEMYGLPGKSWPGTSHVFRRGGSGNEWIPWFKPRGATQVTFFVVGGGGGGGGGRTGASGTARGGGGGGGSSAVTRLTVPACLLPDILWIQVGAGGAGGAANSAGSSGTVSIVSRQPNNTDANVIAISGSTNAGGGSAGTTTGGGGGGSLSSAATAGSAPYLTLGAFTSLAGLPGASGGAHTGANGTSTTALSSHILSGGAGGGGTPTADTNFSGGNINAAGIIPTISGGAAGANGGAGVTFDPFDFLTPPWPFTACGGGGGGTNGASGTGGTGGRGGIGCGGGGGGGGVTGGTGGQGGDGIVVITTI